MYVLPERKGERRKTARELEEDNGEGAVECDHGGAVGVCGASDGPSV